MNPTCDPQSPTKAPATTENARNQNITAKSFTTTYAADPEPYWWCTEGLRPAPSQRPGLRSALKAFCEAPWAPNPADAPCHDGSTTLGSGPFRLPDVPKTRLLRDSFRSFVDSHFHRHSLPDWSSVYDYTVPLTRLPVEFEKFTILHLSDIHFMQGQQRTEAMLSHVDQWLDQWCNAHSRTIDAVVLTGDTITRSPDDLSSRSYSTLKRLSERAPVRLAVLGNHDFYGLAPARVSSFLSDAGFRDLTHGSVRIGIGDSALKFLGIDDAICGRPRKPQWIETTRNKEVAIVLTHNLDAIRSDFPSDIDLILSGHTHWGEVRYLNGTKLMSRWGYYDNVNSQYRGWDQLTPQTVSFVHPGGARYYPPRGIRIPPGVVIHTLTSAHPTVDLSQIESCRKLHHQHRT